MENGGNKKVNAIWEANLAQAGGQKPLSGADLNTRERYIRDKYERRKFYDHQALINYQNSEPSMDELVGSRNRDDDFANFGPPPDVEVSDTARQRAEKKKKSTLSSSTRSSEAPPRSKSGDGGKRRVKKQPAAAAPAAEPEVDLLDLGGDAGGDTGAPPGNNNNSGFTDFFGTDTNNSAQSLQPTHDAPRRQRSKNSRSRAHSRDGARTKSKTPDRESRRKSQQQDILSMYNTAGQGFGARQSSGGNNNSNMMASMMNQMNNMNLNAQQTSNAGGKYNSRLAMHQNLSQPQQMQQGFNPQFMQQMMQQNPQMVQQMMQQMGISPQIMQQMMTMNMNMVNNNHQNTTMQGMATNQNMMNGMNSNSGMYNNMNSSNMMGMNSNNNLQQNQFGGFNAAPMDGGPSAMSSQNGKASKQPASKKEDPFAQFGTNAFR